MNKLTCGLLEKVLTEALVNNFKCSLDVSFFSQDNRLIGSKNALLSLLSVTVPTPQLIDFGIAKAKINMELFFMNCQKNNDNQIIWNGKDFCINPSVIINNVELKDIHGEKVKIEQLSLYKSQDDRNKLKKWDIMQPHHVFVRNAMAQLSEKQQQIWLNHTFNAYLEHCNKHHEKMLEKMR